VAPSLKIEKSLVPVVIYTATHRIEGFYHAFDNGGRLLDDLNEQGRNFIPLTEVRISKLTTDGEVLVSKFLAVNVQSITLFFPNPKVVARKTTESASRPSQEPPVGRQRFVESSFVPDLLVGSGDR
jgi:hypothetical protein